MDEKNKHDREWAGLNEELNDESRYRIKDKCFLCGIKIHNCFKYFKKYGNCCIPCSSRNARTSTDFKHNKEMRDFERELFKQRIKDVKDGKITEQDASYYS